MYLVKKEKKRVQSISPWRNPNKTEVSDVRFTSARSIVHCSRSRRQLRLLENSATKARGVFHLIILRTSVLLLYWILLFYFSNDRIPLRNFALTGARTYVRLCVYVAYIPFPPESPAHTPWGPPTFPPEHSARQHTVHPDWLEKMEGGLHGPEQSSQTSLDGRQWCC